MSLLGFVIEHYNNQSSGCEEAETTAHNTHESGPNFESIRNLSAVLYPLLRSLVLDAIIYSVNCVCLMDLKEKIMNLNFYFSSRHVRKKTFSF